MINVETKLRLSRFQPRSYQKQFIEAFENNNFKKILIVWPRRCLSGETHITMADGSFKFLKDIKVGDEILSWDGNTLVKDTVKNKWSTGIKETRIVRSGSYLPIVSSLNHRFANTSDKNICWTELKDVGSYRSLLQYAGISHGDVHNIELAQFWGFMLADGYVAGYQQPKFTNTRKEILDRVSDLALRLFDVEVIWRKKGKGFDLGFSNKTLGGGSTKNPIKELFRSEGCDRPKSERRLPRSIWNYDEESLLAFFSGLIAADGNLYAHAKGFVSQDRFRAIPPAVEITISCGSSYLYAMDIYWLLRKIGIVPQVPYLEKSSNWKIKIAKSAAVVKLLSQFPIYGKEETQEKVLALSRTRTKTTGKISGLYRSRYKIAMGVPEELFDIETTKHHNFLANGYLVHNSGKDIVAFNLMIRAALRKIGVYYYILPTYAQGKKVIWDSITNHGQKFLDFIPKELVSGMNSQEMKIRLRNGSLIQIVGSDNVDSLVGTNPQGVVFSEYALQDPRAYQFLRPILVANEGWAIFISCVAPKTLVLTSEGYKRIKDISPSREEYSDLNIPVYGLGGFHNADQFYYGGKQKTLKIKLESGFELECTSVHPVWNGEQWIKSGELRVGDLIPIQYGQDVWGPGLDISEFSPSDHGGNKRIPFSVVDDDFFYLLGLIHADGNYNENSVCVTKKKDREIIEFLLARGFKTRPDGLHHEFSSKVFCSLLEHLEFKHGARVKKFPEPLFSCTKQEMRAFIQGVFDGDGCSASHPKKRGYVKLTSTCLEFMQDLQIILTNFGIVSSLRSEDKAPTKKVKVWSRIYNLEITGHFAHVFYRDIGFRLERKQRNWDYVPASCADESGNIYPINITRLDGYSLNKNIVTNPERITRRMIKALYDKKPHPYLKELLTEKLFYSPIKEIIDSENEVFDFVIPETNSFTSNSFLSHNTPRGKNHLWELYNIAVNNPTEWWCSKLTLDDTDHIPRFEIEKEKAEGLISDDLIQQEYYTSFTMGVEGSYYSKYLNDMRLRNQIGQVPWEPSFKVNTAWDLGVRDSTSIIFFQNVGQTVRIIDYYEKNKEGLEHYIKVLESKPYSYGKHIGPHDIRVREFGSGITRWEKAKQLGVTFTMSNDANIVDGIEAVRSTLPRCWIDEVNAKGLLKALEGYRQEFDNKRGVYKSNPLHDHHSHAADAMRYLCVSLPKTRDGLSAQELEKRYNEARYGQTLPSMFQDPHSNGYF